jgi:periplasmic protein CpxP/Spy
MRSLRLLLGIVLVVLTSTVQAGEKYAKNSFSHFSILAFHFQQYQQMSAEDRAKQETEWMKTDLALTPQQIAKVDSINLKYAKKRVEMRGQMQGQDRDAMMAKMQEMQAQKEAELKPVLTEDQMKKYKELLPQRRGMRGQGQGRGN